MAGRVGRRIGGDKITKANTGLLRPENEGFIRMRILLFLKKKRRGNSGRGSTFAY